MKLTLLMGMVLTAITILWNSHGIALEDISLLPKGVRAFMYRQGQISEIGNKYSSNYQLGSIQYRISQRVDAKLIKELNPEFNELVQVMNEEFPGYQLGDKIYLGDLIVEGSPKVNYSAPIIAYGFTDRYMMALAIPMVKFNVNIRARQEGSHNIEAIRRSMPSDYNDYRGQGQVFSDRLEDAYGQLRDSAVLTQKIQEICREKSLRCLGEYKQDIIGDIQWIHRYLLHKGDNWSFMYRAHINLPTGPQDDPDNLIDLPLFHKSFVDSAIVSQYRIGNWKFHNSLGYVFHKTDSVDKRVPSSVNDILPGPERTESLDRKLGDIFKYEFNFSYEHKEKYNFALGMQKEWKSRDSYSGNFVNRDYSLLSRDTGAELVKMKMSVGYSTVGDFLAKRFPVPLSLSYNFSDIVSGKNVERQNLHEFSIAVMF